jgi:hypothetical protein
MRVMLAEQLFPFVTAEPVKKPNGETLVVSGTNNEAVAGPHDSRAGRIRSPGPGFAAVPHHIHRREHEKLSHTPPES